MSPRTRVYAVVAAAAAVAVAAIVGVTWLQARGETTSRPGAVTTPRPGIPPLFFDFGLRNDAETRALATAAKLLQEGKRARAAAVFARYPGSVQAQIGAAFAAWPKGSLDAVRHLLVLHADDPVVNLHYAIALYWSGRNADAEKQFEAVDSKFPDSPSSVDAEDILYAGRYASGLPHMIAPVAIPSGRTIGEQLAKARTPLVRGVIEWYLERRVSARRALNEAARAAPDDPMVQTLDAVAYYSKRNPTAAFSRLGPLTGRFPKAAVVRLHLAELLLWQKQVAKARVQLRAAVADEPTSVYAEQAKELLSALATNGTK
ncbi:MAG: tetratricopeptide repeat protein [Actinomycetota bacterium]